MWCPTILEAIGRTPIVSVDRVLRHHGITKGKAYAKLENLNPGSSKKDRIAKHMIIRAKEAGILKENQPVVELTSGNTGTGLAIACACLGHPFTAVMSKGNSRERARHMQALGANVVLVEQAPNGKVGFVTAEDLKLVEMKTSQIINETGAFRANQFELDSNEDAHYETTGPEIWNSGLRPTAFVDFAGTGGTFSGVAKFLKEHDPKIKCFWVEPNNASSHQIQGGGYFTAPNNDALRFEKKAQERGHIDGRITVTDEQAIQYTRDLAKFEGILGGFSSGANLYAAIKVLEMFETSQGEETVVFTVCDSGLKYLLSTNLFE